MLPESDRGAPVPSFETTRTVPATPETCWAVLTDAARVPEWFTIATSVEVDGRDGEVGQRLRVHGAHLGMSVTIPLTVDVAAAPTAYGWTTDDPLPLTIAFDVAETGDGCVLTGVVDADTSALPRMAVRVAIPSLRQQFARSLDGLARLAEAEAAASG